MTAAERVQFCRDLVRANEGKPYPRNLLCEALEAFYAAAAVNSLEVIYVDDTGRQVIFELGRYGTHFGLRKIGVRENGSIGPYGDAQMKNWDQLMHLVRDGWLYVGWLGCERLL